MTTTPDLLSERYGAPPAWRRTALIAGVAVVVLAFAGWLGWTVWEQSRPVVASEQLGFTVVDSNTATAIVQVDIQDDAVDATCTLRAYAEDHTLVGQVDFYPDPSAGERYVETISTDRLATSVESLGCTAEGQTRPR